MFWGDFNKGALVWHVQRAGGDRACGRVSQVCFWCSFEQLRLTLQKVNKRNSSSTPKIFAFNQSTLALTELIHCLGDRSFDYSLSWDLCWLRDVWAPFPIPGTNALGFWVHCLTVESSVHVCSWRMRILMPNGPGSWLPFNFLWNCVSQSYSTYCLYCNHRSFSWRACTLKRMADTLHVVPFLLEISSSLVNYYLVCCPCKRLVKHECSQSA